MLDDFKLRTALALYREGGFTKAAATLGVSQPAVSQNIAELEKETGICIFRRERGRAVPTREGMVFLRMAESIAAGYDAMNAVFSHDSCDGQMLRVAFSPAAGEILAEGLFEMLGILRPGLEAVRVHDGGPADIVITAFADGKGNDTETVVDFRVAPSEHPLCPLVRQIVIRILSERRII